MDKNEKSVQQNTIVVFGHDYQKHVTELVPKLFGGNIGAKGGKLNIVSGPTASALSFPCELLAPCIIIFSHYIPGFLQDKTPESELAKWKERFLPLCGEDVMGAKKLSFVFNPDGTGLLMLVWDRIGATTCAKIALALQNAFIRCGGALS